MNQPPLHNFYTFGISYKKADVSVRNSFVLGEEELVLYYLETFPEHHCKGFILSTCNRITFFLYGAHPERVEQYFFRNFSGDPLEVGYRMIGRKAIEHLFEVGAGMDSQILGDFEIIGQVRKAFALSKAHGQADGVVEKWVNQCIHTSRRVKNETGLSSGTSSTSYAAVKFLESHLENFKHDPVLILGMGEIGKRTVDNLVAARGPENIYVSNRNAEKSAAICARLGVRSLPWENWRVELNNFAGVVSAVSTPEPIIQSHDIGPEGPQVLLDLSLPNSIDPAISKHEGTTVYDVDQISAHLQKQLKQRENALPVARKIVGEELGKFQEWRIAQNASPVIQMVHHSLANKWEEEAIDAEKIDRIGQKIECRLFNEVRKDPKRVKDIERWLQNLNA